MPYPRHLLQTFEIPSVTQSRFSADYQNALVSQWDIGYQAIFAEALGIAPFKDVRTYKNDRDVSRFFVSLDFLYVSSSTDVCKQERRDVSKTRSLLGSLLNWSRGTRRSLQPYRQEYCHADVVGSILCIIPYVSMNVSAEDGRILKPTKPMRAINAMFIQAAFGAGGPNGSVWTTHTKVSEKRMGLFVVTLDCFRLAVSSGITSSLLRWCLPSTSLLTICLIFIESPTTTAFDCFRSSRGSVILTI